MNWAWSLALRPTTKLVLMSLSDVANDIGECFPSIRYIATRCCISTRHTRREIKKLVELDLLKVETRYRNDGSKTSNLYLLSLPQLGSDNLSPPPISRDTTDQNKVTPKPPGSDVETLSLTTKEPSIKPTTTTTENIAMNWPTTLSQIDRSSIEKFVVDIDFETAQELLDELAGQITNIKRPVAYFHALLRKHEQGLFVPSTSTQVKNSRNAKASNNLAFEHANELHKQRLRNYGIKLGDNPK